MLNYLFNLATGTTNRIISGQFTQDMTDITTLYNTTGKYVSMLGIEYMWSRPSDSSIISFANARGLVAVTDHFNNPASGGNAWDMSFVDFSQLITSGTALNTRFKGYLDSLANNLANLQDNNVVVLFRPYHEMNGSWFWWCGHDPQQYKDLWIYTFNYLTQTKGLHNLLWVYAPNAELDLTYYPGSQYVDVVGVDYYGTGVFSSAVDGYGQLSTLGKPFGLTEFGACSGGLTWEPSSCPPQDISPLITGLKQNMPKTVFWLNWNGVYSMDYNLNENQLLADPWVITRDEISISGGPSDTNPPAAPGRVRVR